MKVQAALTRAEEFAEKKHGAVLAAREAADTADQHVFEPQAALGGAHGEDLHKNSGALESGTKLVVPGLDGSGISRAMVCRPSMLGGGSPWDGSGEPQGAVFGLQHAQADVQTG